MIYLPLIFCMIFQASFAVTSYGICADTSTVPFLVQALEDEHRHTDSHTKILG